MQKIKEFYRKIRNFKLNDRHIFKICAILFFTVIFALYMINQMNLSFLYNNFGDVFKSGIQLYSIYVGQGDSSLLIFPDKTTLLVDTGTEEYSNAFCKELKTILSHNDINQIDYLVLTHPNADHIGGAMELLETFDVKVVYRPKLSVPGEDESEYPVYADILYYDVMNAVKKENCEIRYITPSTFNVDNFEVKFWTPNEIYYSDENSYSPIITVTNGELSFMFTGDATEETEKEFLSMVKDDEIKIDFLKVAHHGSKNSSTLDFLNKIKPSYAIISAGVNNWYNFPSQETIDRLKSVGTKEIYETNELGTIGIGINGVSFKIASGFIFDDKPFLLVLYFCVLFAICSVKISDKGRRIKMYQRFSDKTEFSCKQKTIENI